MRSAHFSGVARIAGRCASPSGDCAHGEVQLLRDQSYGSAGGQDLERIGVEERHLCRVEELALGTDERVHGQDDVAEAVRCQQVARLLLGRAV